MEHSDRAETEAELFVVNRREARAAIVISFFGVVAVVLASSLAVGSEQSTELAAPVRTAQPVEHGELQTFAYDDPDLPNSHVKAPPVGHAKIAVDQR